MRALQYYFFVLRETQLVCERCQVMAKYGQAATGLDTIPEMMKLFLAHLGQWQGSRIADLFGHSCGGVCTDRAPTLRMSRTAAPHAPSLCRRVASAQIERSKHASSV